MSAHPSLWPRLSPGHPLCLAAHMELNATYRESKLNQFLNMTAPEGRTPASFIKGFLTQATNGKYYFSTVIFNVF